MYKHTTKLAFCISSVLYWAASAMAASPPDTVTKLDTVTVTGYRASLEKAQSIKRSTNSIVDAISAEDIGKFPDTNAAESLSHLPGISVDRQFGEGEKSASTAPIQP